MDMIETIWFREFEDGDWEMGLLMKEHYGWIMDADGFPYYFRLDLSQWQYIGEL